MGNEVKEYKDKNKERIDYKAMMHERELCLMEMVVWANVME